MGQNATANGEMERMTWVDGGPNRCTAPLGVGCAVWNCGGAGSSVLQTHFLRTLATWALQVFSGWFFHGDAYVTGQLGVLAVGYA